MDFINKLFAFLPFVKKEEEKEYLFALNIGQQDLEAALWTLFGKNLEILQTASAKYSSLDEIVDVTDRLLDNVLGVKEFEVKKILFGVADTWLSEDDLKEEYLKLLRRLVKDLDLSPMAYVATSHAILHFLENKEGVPTTAILVGFEQENLVVTVSRAGKLDGSKLLKRSDNPGLDIEKALLTFTNVETLPSRILIYGQQEQRLEKLKTELLPFSWMSKLSFLHFPKIDILEQDLQIKSICLAGAKEINPDAIFIRGYPIPQAALKQINAKKPVENKRGDLGFVVGDVSEIQKRSEEVQTQEVQGDQPLAETFERSLSAIKHLPQRFGFRSVPIWIGALVLITIIFGYLFLPKAHVKIFVEPQVLEKDAEIIADPKVKQVDKETNVIPGQIVEIRVSGSGKGEATGKKEIGDPAKGKVVIFNATNRIVSLSKGTILVNENGTKFSLDTNVQIASKSASAAIPPTQSDAINTTAEIIGADGNIPAGTELKVSNLSKSEVVGKAEGNFSGGTSKQATVVSESDQSRLLAQVASQLRQQAQQKLQEDLKDKKVLEEALSEEIVKKSFSKNINDQASEFSLNLTVSYKGTAFDDKDLKLIVSKLVDTQVPEGFELNFEETETQADVSKLEADGKLIFLSRFRAKLLPKLDLEKIKKEVKGKTPDKAAEILKEKNHILGSDIVITPTFPYFLKRIPFLERNIEVEVGLK